MVILKLLLFAVVVGVSSQSYPHFEFREKVLVNNSFIARGGQSEPERIREGHNDSLHCVTDNSECCGNGQGDWYDERGRQVQQGPDGEGDLYVTRGDGVVHLNRRRGGSSGMWRCDIPDSNGVNQSIYIYLGTLTTGAYFIPMNVYFALDSEANEDPPEFTLTCQSKGGPVTEVEWRRIAGGNSVMVEEDSNHTTSQIIVDTSSNAVYNNTLRVRGRETTVTYTCTVSNNRHKYVHGSMLVSARRIIPAAMEPTSVSATYKTPTSISLEWAFAMAPLYDYSYVVYYESGGERHSVSFTDSGRSRDNSHLLTGLPVGRIHTISLVALVDLPSPVVGPVAPVSAEPPEVVVSGEGSGVVGTSYTLTCRVRLPSGVEPDSLDIQWLGLPPTQRVMTTAGVYNTNVTLDLILPNTTEYTCSASYTANGVSSKLVQAHFNITVGEMSVELVGSGSREVGSVYTLTCTVALSNRARDSSVSIQWLGPSTDEQTVDTTGNRVITSQLSLDPLSLAHGGNYTCTASYTVDGGTTVTTSDTERVIPIIAPISVMLRISEDIILVGEDVVVYCDIDLIGVVGGRDVAVEVTWFQEGVPVRPDSRLTISGATGDVGGVHSSLTFSPVHLSDVATYECHVTLTPLLGPASTVSSSASIFLNISEPVDPVRPEDVTFREVQSGSVTVQWRVSHISYSPETYVVQYGTSRESLIHNSSRTRSEEGAMTYSVQLSGLRDNTTYYVQVLATNTALRFSRSRVENFTTLPTMELKSGEDQPGSSLALPVGVSISVFIAVLTTVIVIMFILLRRQRNARKKYSFKEGNLSIARKSYPTDVVGMGEEGQNEGIEMEGPLVNAVVDDETCEEDGVQNLMQEETEDYFEDPTSILLADIDPIPTERFPEYVRDMLYGEENKLKAEFWALGKLRQPPSTVAVLPHNKAHNRFNNIYPYDRSRVCLKETPGVDSCDYINASFIDGYGGRQNAYIAAQGPVDVSVERFWRMVWEYEIPTILMLTQCAEAGKVKCVQYWPEKLHDSLSVGQKFRVTFSSNMPFAEYEFRKFKLENLSESESKHMTVSHLHYTAWPDHGVPDNVMSLIAFIRHVRKLHPVSHQQPLLVHCSAGVGRTGTLILLDIIMQQMKTEGTISVLHWLRNLRMQRMMMVQSQQQYEFIHCGLSELVVCGETEVAAANLRIALKNLKKKGPDGLTGFQTQMQIIEEVSSHHPVTFSDAEKEYNRSKNRFPDKLPNDTYLVRLRCGPMPGSDYINASFVNGYKQKGAYIATQCPLENTVADFWRMVNEFQCGCVVMLQEEGEESSRCFWPEEEGESVVDGKLSIKLVSVKTHGDIVTRKLEMVEGAARLNRPHMVHLLQLTSWPLQGLPHPTAILSLIDQLTSTQMRCGNRRTVIMCSDGVSRTGTFLTIHCQLERLKTEGVVDFLQAIKSARLHRPGLVNNTDHYVFCHEVVNMYLDNFDTYSNFEFKEVI